MKQIKQVVEEITNSGADLNMVLKRMRRANAKLEARIRAEKKLNEAG